MNVCMICTTPFQIWTAICLVKSYNLCADIYIGNRFVNHQLVTDSIRKTCIFNKVVVVDQDKILNDRSSKTSKIKRRIKLVQLYRNIDRVIGDITEDILYDEVYISSNAVVCRAFALYHIKNNKNTKVIYYDDGIGSYSDEKIIRYSRVERIYQRLLIGNSIETANYSYCLFDPELFYRMYPNDKGIVKKIFPIERNYENDKIVRSVFGIESTITIKERIIVLDTVRDAELTIDGISKIESIYKNLTKKYEGDIIFKQHPRFFDFDTSLPHFEKPSIPFEYLCYCNDQSDKIIITNISSAAFTPKLLFDQEPILVFLYKILKDDTKLIFEMEKVVEQLRLRYKRPERIIMPENYEDLFSTIEGIMKYEQQ